MAVCIYSMFVLSCVGIDLAMTRSSVLEVLPTVYRIKKLKKLPRPKELYKHRKKVIYKIVFFIRSIDFIFGGRRRENYSF
jgi:hypothetical protein